MGVAGLLKLLQPYSQQRSPSEFEGKTLGIDGYSWLHRAAASCAEDLSKGIPTTRLVQSIDNRVRVYEQNGVELFFVFDGGSFKMKERVEKQRKRVREAARAQSSTSSTSSSSSSYSSTLRGVDITANHAAMVIAYLKVRGIRYVVAPYEADAQLVWLEKEGMIHGIISEDSDLLVFGAQTLLTKCDSKTGQCIEISRKRLPPPLGDLRCLRALAIISGCDYSPGVNGLGPVKSKALVQRFRGDLRAVIEHLISSNRTDEKFLDLAQQADLAFQFQRVWNPNSCCLSFLNMPALELRPQITDSIVGDELPRSVAHRIAHGIIDPHDQKRELHVDTVIAQFVQRMRPYAASKKGRQYASPQGISRAINRKLNASPLSSSPAASPQSISRFFQPQGLAPKNMNIPTTLPSPDASLESILPEPVFKIRTPAFSAVSSDVFTGSTAAKRVVNMDPPAQKLMRTDTIVDQPSQSPQTRVSMIRQFAFTPK